MQIVLDTNIIFDHWQLDGPNFLVLEKLIRRSSGVNCFSSYVNKRVYHEEERLAQRNDHLYLEFTNEVPGYNLGAKGERKLAEALLIGYYRPYLMK